MVHQGCNAAHQHSSKAEQRPSKAEESSRLQSFRRDLTRASFFLASNFFRLIGPALALPTPTVTTTASSTNSAPSATSSAGADRGSTFQVFADGTQDIAALVGIFATDSVEKYAIDYSKGYLATAVANLSLLGLLGYVRLLVKLALGAKGCRKAGFDMKALRPVFGVQDEEYVPKDAVHEVCYMRRQKSKGQVHWSIVKIIKHTEESFQLLNLKNFRKGEDLEIVSVWLIGPTYVLVLPLLSILCSALTCFPIMIFERPQKDHQSWTYYYATVGLFCSTVISTMTWMWVHIQEQHPRECSDWTVGKFNQTLQDAFHSRYKQLLSKVSSLDLKDTFAFSQVEKEFHIYDVSATERKFRFALKILSLLLSGSILIGYACQYIEVRRLSVIQSGHWLLIQGALAFIRVVVWVWDPSWDDSRITTTRNLQIVDGLWMYDLTETRLVLLWASLSKETCLRWGYSTSANKFSIPNWVLPALSSPNQNPEQMFELARKLSRDTIEWDESLQVLQNAEDFWDMPPSLFMAWVFAWPNSDPSWVDGHGAIFSCRIIKDKQYENGVQKLHCLPCWCYDYCHMALDEDGLGRWVRVRVFGVPYNRNRCVFAFDEVPERYTDQYTDNARPLQHKLVVGCDTPILAQYKSTPAEELRKPVVEEMFEAMDLMWKSLDPILNAVRIRPTIPPRSEASTEPRTPMDPVRTSQRASPTGSAIELAPLPAADEETQSDADIIGPQPRRRTN